MTERDETRIENICMLSTHGYFDPVPQLGRTDTGGQVVYVLRLADALSKKKIKVDIYTRWFDGEKYQIESVPDNPNVRVIRIPAGPMEFIPKEQLYDVLPELTGNMIAFIREAGLEYDLFHGHYVDAGIVTLEAAKAFGKPPFFTAHSLGAWKREQMCEDPAEMEGKYNFARRISEELRIFRSVKAQTVTTHVQEEKLEQLYGFKSDNVAVIPPGVDIHNFRPSPPGDTVQETGLPDRYIFCLSRIDCNKGHDLLLKAFDLVREEFPGVHLVIGGGSPEPQERESGILSCMKSIIEERGMRDRVHIVGYVADETLVAAYRRSELFVLPSIFEPFGMTALEAMACGRPVIVSKLGGIRNYIKSGENGILVDPSDSGEFAAAISLLLGDRRLADRIGKQGCRTIHEHFSWEAIAEKHLSFYKEYI